MKRTALLHPIACAQVPLSSPCLSQQGSKGLVNLSEKSRFWELGARPQIAPGCSSWDRGVALLDAVKQNIRKLPIGPQIAGLPCTHSARCLYANGCELRCQLSHQTKEEPRGACCLDAFVLYCSPLSRPAQYDLNDMQDDMSPSTVAISVLCEELNYVWSSRFFEFPRPGFN
ncbi:hypothetical protein H4582DRAFT_635490 [Lactarius indigo]|nr:hypothetical protein H4582DRAFT_635490 [Lactarius indigo]